VDNVARLAGLATTKRHTAPSMQGRLDAVERMTAQAKWLRAEPAEPCHRGGGGVREEQGSQVTSRREIGALVGVVRTSGTSDSISSL